MRSGLIVNPRSGSHNLKGLDLAHRVRGASGVEVAVLDDFARLPSVLAGFASAGVERIFISSGDGTVQAIQTELAERRPFHTLPALCLMPHGTTNMTAADLGFHTHRLGTQADFIRTGIPKETVERATIRVVNPADGLVRHGMFVGAGAVWQAARFTQDSIHKKGLKGNVLGPLATLLAALRQALFSRDDPADPTWMNRPHWMRIEQDGVIMSEREHLFLLISTLEKLVIGARPFWGGKGGGPVRLSVFPWPQSKVLLWVLPVLYGGEKRRMPEGALSLAGSGFDITTRSSFVIDGEFFDPPETSPLHLESGPNFTYIRS